MKYQDSELVKDGIIDFDYAYKWFSSIKSFYDSVDLVQDMVDIEFLLGNSFVSYNALCKKLEELEGKYWVYVRIVNSFNCRGNYCQQTCNNNVEHQLRLFYNYIPVFGLLKFGVTKIFDNIISELFRSDSKGTD